MSKLLAVVIFFSAVAIAQAEPMYIEDQLKLPMRTGQSTGHAIVRMLSSGSKVEVLERNKETGYTHVRTSGGAEGWVLSRYLMQKPAARSRLVAAEKKLAKLAKENRNLNARLRDLDKEKGALDKGHALLLTENKRRVQELKDIRLASSNAVAIAEENKVLTSKLATAGDDIQLLRQEVSDLKSGVAQTWFLIGGGAVLLGILLGLFLPNFRMRRQSRWGRY